jgi:hypothetical protein
MKVANGNDKLGKGCLVVSRPVGDTCPTSCVFLGNGCYAEQTEKMYPSVRPAGMQNLITERGRIRAMILDAKKSGKSIRWHERGDWGKDNDVDMQYVENVMWACETIVEQGDSLPDMWFYSHIYDSRVSALSKYMNVYASIHNADDKAKAIKSGFTMFAWCDTNGMFPKRPKPKAKADAWRNSLPKLVVIDDTRYIVCPEIRRGRGVVTCTPTKGSTACNMCVRGLANVFFPSH